MNFTHLWITRLILYSLALSSGSCEGIAKAAARAPGDLGVILGLGGADACSYVNPSGVTTSCTGTLAITYVAGAEQSVGAYGSAAFDIHVASYTGTASITVKVEVKRTDAANNFWTWEPVLTVLSDATGVPTTAFEQVLTTTTGTDVRLLTTDSRLSGTLRVSAKAATAAAAVQIFVGGSVGAFLN